MRKLYRLKKWYSLEDAAKRLSLTLGEPIEKNDVLQLMADGELFPYWYVRGRYGQEVAPVTHLYRAGDPLFDLKKDMGELPDNCNLIAYQGHEPQVQKVELLDGIFKLCKEQTPIVTDWLTSLVTGTDQQYTSLDGVFLISEDDKLWRLMLSFEDNEFSKKDFVPEKPWNNPNNFHPDVAFPNEDEIVVTKAELERFESQLLEPTEKSLPLVDKPLQTRERNTLLKIIAALCAAQKLDLKHPYKAAEIIKNEIELSGGTMSVEAIADKLEQARQS